MIQRLFSLIFAAFSAARVIAADRPLVTVREEVMPVRDGRDAWVADWDATFAYTNGEGRVNFKGNKFCLYHKWDYPGGERLRGAAEYVVKLDAPLEGEAELDIRRERKGCSKTIKAKVGKNMQFLLRKIKISKITFIIHHFYNSNVCLMTHTKSLEK